MQSGSTAPIDILVDHVSKVFPSSLETLKNIHLQVKRGEFIVLLGPSGSGKSTLLKLIAGLEEPTQGSIQLSPSANIAFVFQDAHLLPWRTVVQNVELPLEFKKISSVEKRNKALEFLKLVDLSDFADFYPAQLSGGMKMRASIARALVTDPSILLMDEPFAALDELNRYKLDETLHKIWLEKKITTVFVTHSIAEAVFLAQRVVALTPRPAQILFEETIPAFEQRDRRLRSNVQYMECVQKISERFWA